MESIALRRAAGFESGRIEAMRGPTDTLAPIGYLSWAYVRYLA